MIKNLEDIERHSCPQEMHYLLYIYLHKLCRYRYRNLLEIGKGMKMSWTSTSRKGGTGAGSQCIKADKVWIMLLFCKWKKLDLTI